MWGLQNLAKDPWREEAPWGAPGGPLALQPKKGQQQGQYNCYIIQDLNLRISIILYIISNSICEIFNAASYLPDIDICTPLNYFFKNSAFEYGLSFLRNIPLSRNLSCFLCFCGTLLPKCAYRPWNRFMCFCKTNKNHWNNSSRILAWGVFSHFLFSLYLKKTWATSSPPLPTRAPRRRRRWPSRCGRPRPLNGRHLAPRQRRTNVGGGAPGGPLELFGRKCIIKAYVSQHLEQQACYTLQDLRRANWFQCNIQYGFTAANCLQSSPNCCLR